MKKITLFFFLLTFNFCIAQTWTTGQVQLEADRTVQFDINQGTGFVTMTMIFPETTWLGVGPGITTGLGMGNLDDDAIVYSANGLEDRNMQAGTGEPPLDASQDWSVSSDTTSGGQRTVIATRAIDTGDAEDFVFPTSVTTFPIIYAKGGTLTLGYHGSGKYGGTVVNVTLGTPEVTTVLNKISIQPNPASDHLNIKLPEPLINKMLTIEVYDVLGKKITKEYISKFRTSINVVNWNSGLYLVKISSKKDNVSVTKRFMKL